MKILFLHNYFHVKSGSNVVMFQEAELLKQQGHEVYYFCTDKKPYFDENYEYLGYFPKYINFKNLSLKNEMFNLFKPFYNTDAVKKFGLFLDKIKPDIVHEHTTSFHLTGAVLTECYKRKIPVVVTIHGPGYFCPAETLLFKKEKFCENLYCKGINKFHCIYNQCYEGNLFNKLYEVLVYTFYYACGFRKKASAFICPSNAVLNLADKSSIPNEKLFLAENFINCRAANSENYSLNRQNNSNYFLYVGRLVKEKGVYNLIEAWNLLPREIELHIVGAGIEEDKLKELAKKYNLENIKFKGFSEGEELEKEYKGCIANILPALGFEAFGLTILESFSYGKPVIATNIGGIPEIVKNNKNGILIEPGNIEELEKAALKLYKSPDLAQKMGIAGRYTAENEFNPQMHFNKLIKIYEKFALNKTNKTTINI